MFNEDHFYRIAENEPADHHLRIREDADHVWWVKINNAVIGVGHTRDAAVADAMRVVEWMEGLLQGPPPHVGVDLGAPGGDRTVILDKK